MTVHVLTLALALSAPAPFPRTTQPAATSPIGAWTLNWGHGGSFQVTFATDGSYACDAGGKIFTGFWRLEGRLLVITETEVTRDPYAADVWHSHRLHLDPGKLAGKVEGRDIRFDLGPPSRVPRAGPVQ
jgi:hypothetical protein